MSGNIAYLREHKTHVIWAIDRMNKHDGPLVERNASITKEILKGETYDNVAAKHGISRERVRQIAFKTCAAALSIEARHNKKALWVAHNAGIGHLMSPLHRPARYEASDCETPRCQ